MKDLDLPRFEIPEHPRARIPEAFYWEWVMQGILRLHRAGRLADVYARRDRRPVDVQFRLCR
jgi:hypothetical protein